ncbi:MAG: DUF4145 domain-containing protein [Pyrinomonadaceae bacterium]
MEFDLTFECPSFECRSRIRLDDVLSSRRTFPVVICPSCERLLELQVSQGGSIGGTYSHLSLQFEVRTIRTSDLAKIPEEIVLTIKEAIRCFAAGSYYGCAAMCRRIVEGIVVTKNARGNNLKQKIDDLGNKKLISERVAWEDQWVRSLGNIACHFDTISENQITFDVAWVCLATAYEVAKEVFLGTSDRWSLRLYGIERFNDRSNNDS